MYLALQVALAAQDYAEEHKLIAREFLGELIVWCFGMIRYMPLKGMKRKTNVEAYIWEIRRIEGMGKDPFRLP